MNNGLPRHVGLIPDGNGRWAEQRGLARAAGYAAGAAAVRRIVEAACQLHLPVLTLFVFSEENWERPPEDVHAIFRAVWRFLVEERDTHRRGGIRISGLGRRDRLPLSLSEALAASEAQTRANDRLHLRLAIDYGAREEIARAARALARRALSGQLDPEAVDAALLTEAMRNGNGALAEPDLIIRTGGEQRLSDFLLFESAYAELYFTETLWPDFTAGDLQLALEEFQRRERRFGRIEVVVA